EAHDAGVDLDLGDVLEAGHGDPGRWEGVQFRTARKTSAAPRIRLQAVCLPALPDRVPASSVSAQDLLTPRMAALLQRIARANRPGFETMTPGEARIAYTAAAEVLEPPRAPLPR